MSLFRISSILKTMSKRNNSTKWYAVRKGRKPGIYTQWNDCNAQVTGFKGSEFKSFTAEKDAQEYLKDCLNSGGGPVGEKRKLEAVLSSNNMHDNEERPQKVQKITKNITLIVENDKCVLQNEHGEVHIDHNLQTITTIPKESSDPNSNTTSPRKQRKPRVRKNADKKGTADSTQEVLNSEGKIDASMLKNYGTTANSNEQPVVVFIDGACTNNGTPHAKAGYGAFFGKDDKRNISKPLEGTKQTNQRAEIMAAIAALRQIETDKPVELRTDSHYVMKAMTEWMPNWKKTNFKKPVENLDLFKTLDEVILSREAQVLWTYVPAHTGIYGNEKADELAKKGASDFHPK
eukprot:TRINITY_DN11887_c0_g1_i1.p1 TRINITY_DN11887_c0_g1~~TRINITY_DN11887_c0_g1_i1.p1  ORF type:complete len:347 (+),score=56.19 TRINITY_DN11887_c0_g1_i1:42-1082(+)